MKSRTHLVVGLSSSLLLVHPTDWHTFAVGAVTAVVGGTVSDIDSRMSRPHGRATLLIALIFLSVIGLVVADGEYELGLYRSITGNEQAAALVKGGLAFVLICALGMNIKHRAFMHSFFGMVALTFCVFLMDPVAVPFFVIAFMAHIFLDFLNSYDIYFFYPFSFCKYCLRVAEDDGFLDRIIFMLGTALSIWLLVLIPADIMGFFSWLAEIKN